MPDTSFMAYLTASTYWSLILCWSAILVFYAVEYRRLRKINPLVATLIVVIFIDGLRTLIESAYFGTWYTARTGLIPYSLFELLTKPEYLVIPKLMNLAAAIIIIAFVVRRWFPDVTDGTNRHLDLARYHTELVEAHAELQNLEQLRDGLVHMIAHDMRTPLTSIMGSLQTALDAEDDDEVAREMIHNSMHAAERLETMTANLLDINRMEAGQLPLEVEPVGLADALAGAAAGMRHLAQEKGIHLAVTSDSEDVVATADADILARVLDNLLQNALRHTPPGGRVTLEVRETQVAGETMALISVRDTGEGIPEDMRELTFDRFFHAARERHGHLASIGLGLAFCRLAVEAHGGRIWVESQAGEGTAFYLTIPM